MKKLKVEMNIAISLEISQLKVDSIIKEIKKILLGISQEIFQAIITGINNSVNEWVESKLVKIKCNKCGSKSRFTRRGSRKDKRGITTSIGRLFCEQLQMLECSECQYRFSPVLQILGINRYQCNSLHVHITPLLGVFLQIDYSSV